MAVFSGQSLSCVRGQTIVFENLSFTVGGGGILALSGVNGAGKTSLLRLMAGFLKPAAGTLLWNNEPFDAPEEKIHWLGVDNALKPDLTVRENLSYWARGGDTDAALAKMDMSAFARAPARYLSAGQKRRAALCRLFLSPRPLWLLDEPANSLDAASESKLHALVKEHAAGGGMAIIATHNPQAWHPDNILKIGAAA
ncbi:MAG: heme ABC exporter ATP-binding protein CcmA [Proteobacteria bacterium]|nr:heme ABC exporter ATP-binding protein CcmA [Pseudomonadota bacterium]